MVTYLVYCDNPMNKRQKVEFFESRKEAERRFNEMNKELTDSIDEFGVKGGERIAFSEIIQMIEWED